MKNGCLIIQDSSSDTMLTFSNNEALLKKIDVSLLSSLDYSERGYSSTVFQGAPVTVLYTSAQTPNLNYYLIVPTVLPESTWKRTAVTVSIRYLSRCRRKLFDYCLLSKANYKPL